MNENKPIIIDGINVSGREHITYKNSLNPMCGNTGICCYGRKDCYFKQLARKTQECEELKEKIKYMEGYIKTVEKARDELERENKSTEQAEQKLEQIKQVCKDYCKIMCLCETKETCESCINTEILQIIDEVE